MELQRRGSVDMSWTDMLGAVGMSRLPGDLMVEILGRLPVKSIFRFKSVCKAWHDLFKSPMFIRHHTHLARSSMDLTKTFSLLVHTRSQEGICHILSLVLDGPCSSPMTKILNPPFDFDLSRIQVVGSVNGLVCLSLGHDGTFILLWNPTIRELIQIPKPQLLAGIDERVSVGLAYDLKTETYKVIRVLYSKSFTSKMRPAKVEIFNSRTNSWRSTTAAGFPWLCYQKTCSTLVNGVPYWNAVELLEQGGQVQAVELMAWFDVQDEIFRFFPLPFYNSFSGFRLRLGVWGDNPVAIVYSVERHREGQMMIWEFNRNHGGGKGSTPWSKVVTIKPVSGLESVVGCWRNGEIVAQDHSGALFVYDPQPKQVIDFPCCGPWGFVEVYAYIESLVSPSSLALDH